MIKLKNNEERKQWLRNYKDWGVWYKDEHIGVTYYHYVFDDGAELIVEEYVVPAGDYIPEHTYAYYHLVGGPNPPDRKWNYHPIYDRYADSETYLVEFLKYVGKEEEQ